MSTNPQTTPQQPRPHQPRPETSGAGAVTVLVLLLLMGGVDCRSAAAFSRAATGLVYEEVEGSPAPQIGVVARLCHDVDAPSALRDTSRGERPAMTVSDAMLPAPRAPDHDQVV
jgi:hypothetical protein